MCVFALANNHNYTMNTKQKEKYALHSFSFSSFRVHYFFTSLSFVHIVTTILASLLHFSALHTIRKHSKRTHAVLAVYGTTLSPNVNVYRNAIRLFSFVLYVHSNGRTLPYTQVKRARALTLFYNTYVFQVLHTTVSFTVSSLSVVVSFLFVLLFLHARCGWPLLKTRCVCEVSAKLQQKRRHTIQFDVLEFALHVKWWPKDVRERERKKWLFFHNKIALNSIPRRIVDWCIEKVFAADEEQEKEAERIARV